MVASGRDHHLADPAASSIQKAGLRSRGMSVPITDLSFTVRHLTGGGGSVATYCAAQFNVSFLRS
jgi:hypothetical protein